MTNPLENLARLHALGPRRESGDVARETLERQGGAGSRRARLISVRDDNSGLCVCRSEFVNSDRRGGDFPSRAARTTMRRRAMGKEV